MKRLAVPMGLVVAACQQAPAPADNAAAKANEIVIAKTDTQTSEGAAPAKQPTTPKPAPIPAKFRGIWAESHAFCAHLSHPSRLIISETSLRYPTFVLVADRVDLPTDSSLAVKGRIKRTQALIEAHFSIDVTGNILTDEAGGGAVRVNCP